MQKYDQTISIFKFYAATLSRKLLHEAPNIIQFNSIVFMYKNFVHYEKERKLINTKRSQFCSVFTH